MKRPRLFVALFASTLSVAAQTAPAVRKPGVPTGRVTGAVLCSDTRKPCRGAEVFLKIFPDNTVVGPTFDSETIAGIDGVYVFDNLPPGKYVVIASLPGYLSSYIVPQPEGQPDAATRAAEIAKWVQSLQIVVASSQTSIHDITLIRGASLSGRVLYADGSPAIHAFIRVEHADPDQKTGEPDRDHHVVPTDRNTASTNDVGEFRISGIRPDRYRVAAVPRLLEGSGDYDPPSFAIYSGDTIHRKAAKVYALRLNENVGDIEITIPLGGLHRVSGRLATSDDHSLNMGSVTLASTDDDSILYRVDIDSHGDFAFASVPPGAYALTLTDAFIGTPADTTKDPESTRLIPTRAFTAETLPILVKDTDLSDIHPMLKEIPLPPQANNDEY